MFRTFLGFFYKDFLFWEIMYCLNEANFYLARTTLKMRLGLLFMVDHDLTENIWFWPGFAPQNAVSQLTSEQPPKKKIKL